MGYQRRVHGKFNLLKKMFKYLAALVALTSASDLPKKYQWAAKCDWEDTDYEKYGHFNKVEKMVDNRDVCLLAHAHFFATADLDSSFSLDRCEWSYACVTMTLMGEGHEDPTHEQGVAAVKKCVKVATEHINGKDGLSLPEVGADCAKRFPTLKGTPFEHE